MKHSVNFVCPRCSNRNKDRRPKKADIVSCDQCGMKVAVESRNQTYVSFNPVEKDDIGSFIKVSQETEEGIKKCNDCEEVQEEGKKLYIIEQGYRSSEVKCESCMKKDTIVEGLDTGPDDIGNPI